MDEVTLGAVMRRLDRLERENRCLRRVVAVALVGVTAGLLMG